MSHRYPRLIANTAGATFVNSMHGIVLLPDAPPESQSALPLLSLNSVTLLGAKIHGRSYGGGILKMEPREAATLPVPAGPGLTAGWQHLHAESGQLDEWLSNGRWHDVVSRVDEVLLGEVMGIRKSYVEQLRAAGDALRARRMA